MGTDPVWVQNNVTKRLCLNWKNVPKHDSERLKNDGLLCSLYANGVQLKILNGETDVNFGAVYENYVAQELAAHGFGSPSAWVVSRSGEIATRDKTTYLPIYMTMFLERERLQTPLIYKVDL